MEKLRVSSKKTVKRSIVNYTKMLFRTKGMTCNTNGINSITQNQNDNTYPKYNLNGQKVLDSYKGIVIQNGRKVIMNK